MTSAHDWSRTRSSLRFGRPRGASGSGRVVRTGPRRRARSSGSSADSRHLMPFSRYLSPAEPDMAQRQERQIVQSQLNLDGFLP